MKKLMIASAFILSANVVGFAQTPPTPNQMMPKEDFAIRKQKILEHLQKMTECVNAAQSENDLKVCHEKNKHPHPERHQYKQ
jgi:hypothetical protein